MKFSRVIISSILVWLVTTAIIGLTCGWLFSWVYTIPPIIWKDPSTVMSLSNQIGSNLLGIIRAFIFVLIYSIIYKGIPSKGIKKGIVYGAFIWLLGSYSGLASMPLYMQVNQIVIIYWMAQALVINLINGVIMASICKEK